jgi:uncharacterized membrane protein YuzA (DUF378 family)
MEAEPTPGNIAFFFTALGAINWGIREFIQFNAVTEFGLPPELVYALITVAGVVTLTDRFEITDFFEEA